MSPNTPNSLDTAATGGSHSVKGSRQPYLKPEAGTSWFTVKPTDDIYGPCSLEIKIDTAGVLGQEGQVDHIKTFCDGFGEFPETCIVKGYGVQNSVWTVSLDLASEKAGATKEFVNRVSAALTPYLQASPILQRQHGFGDAECRILDGGTTRFTDDLN